MKSWSCHNLWWKYYKFTMKSVSRVWCSAWKQVVQRQWSLSHTQGYTCLSPDVHSTSRTRSPPSDLAATPLMGFEARTSSMLGHFACKTASSSKAIGSIFTGMSMVSRRAYGRKDTPIAQRCQLAMGIYNPVVRIKRNQLLSTITRFTGYVKIRCVRLYMPVEPWQCIEYVSKQWWYKAIIKVVQHALAAINCSVVSYLLT